MKFIVFKKRDLIVFSAILCLLISSIVMYFFFTKSKEEMTLAPIESGKSNSFDLNGDKIADAIEIISSNNKEDIKVTIGNKNYLLSSLCENEILGETKSHWPTKVFIHNISRNSTPEIIVQTYKDGGVNYVFTWDNDNFKLLHYQKGNIFGILDSNSSKTPQCYSFSSSSPSKDSFMIINNEIIGTTNEGKNIPDLNNIIKLIDLVQTTYELDSAPDIFTEGIAETEIGLLWNLDKENNQYSFQDAFFYDESTDNEGNITSMKWRLTFEKYILDKDDSSKKEVVIYATTSRTYDNQYKISSLYKN